jgi:arylsulfatase A-like enzyme
LFADAAVEFLKGYKDEAPFYCYVPFTAPHDPRQPPLEFREMYYQNRPPLPANYLPQHPFDNGHMMGGRDENLGPWPRTKDVIGDQLCEYYGMITHLDQQIGRILTALEESGHAENTIIIFAADHGLAMGSHGLLGKQSIYEHSMRCPLIFSGPGIPKGESSEAFSYLLDIFPTVCALTGVEPPAKVEGQSLQPVWTGERESVRESVFLPFRSVQRSIRDERWKLIVYPEIGHMQLFDLENDLNEMHNLIEDPNHADEVARLLELMGEWQAQVGDTLEVPSESKPAPPVDLTGRPREPDKWQPEWIREKYFSDE